MTAQELIEKLQKFPQDLEVRFNDNEYGPQSIEDVVLNENYPYPFTCILID